MLSVDEALKLVLDHAPPLPARSIPLESVLGCLLAEEVASDIDSPPHDKSIVDGYAVIASSVSQPNAVLSVLEEVTAGALPTRPVEPSTATRIMTGAPLPAGADAVVMVEKTSLEMAPSGERVTIHEPPARAGQNIVRRGTSMRRGQTVLPAGTAIRAIELGLLAEVGRESVLAIPRPRVAILATGDELVPHGQVPSAGQIRNSNGPLLAGLVRQAGGEPVELGIARDEKGDLARLVLSGLDADVLVLSGGVSAGVLDLVPQVLADLGVRQVFHKVNLKPGKPLWFGERIKADGRRTVVFGLPGNPVSSLVCFELFVRPALAKLCGVEPKGLPQIWAALAIEHQQRGDRPTFWPAKLESGELVTPLAWQGSGDLRTLAEADCLAYFPPGDRIFAAGEMVAVSLIS
ncbi:MAG: molybdopterin molybdotransferase MoeA [Pirellulaceae bacterium]|nr:molybdopterin molybdotransferase MoeA [Pirellulaceae bacterium]